MFNLDKKSLRKSEDQINLKPDSEVLADEATHLAAGDYLTKRRGSPCTCARSRTTLLQIQHLGSRLVEVDTSQFLAQHVRRLRLYLGRYQV